MYAFNTNLHVGDIILVRGAAKHSKLIAKLTAGHFSHAMVVLENDIFLEAITGSGVQTTSMLRVSFQDKANFLVLRCKFPDKETSSSVISFITSNFASYQGRNYSYKAAAESIKRSGGDSSKGGYFCSHLVAALYADAGFPLLDKPAYKTTPNDLLCTNLLENVTEHVTSKIPEIAIERVKASGKKIECLDAGASTVSTDAQNHRKLLRDSAKYFTRSGLPIPNRCGEFPDILTNPSNSHFAKDLDYQISKNYKKIGINEYVIKEFSKANYEQDKKLVTAEVEKFGYDHALDIYKSYIYIIMTRIVRLNVTKESYDFFNFVYKEWGFKYFLLKVEYYDLIGKSISELIEFHLYIVKYIEDAYPDKLEQLFEIKALTINMVIERQADTLNKENLLSFINDLVK